VVSVVVVVFPLSWFLVSLSWYGRGISGERISQGSENCDTLCLELKEV
jgi:hypothetical protein